MALPTTPWNDENAPANMSNPLLSSDGEQVVTVDGFLIYTSDSGNIFAGEVDPATVWTDESAITTVWGDE